jgi:hypothetical protein
MRRALPAVLLVVAAAIILALIFSARVSRKMPDLEVYWTAASRARHAEPLYRPDDGHYQFKYLPAFAVLTMPAAGLTIEAAKAVWFVTSVVLLAALLSLSLAALPERRKPAWLLVTLTLVVMLKFYGHELVLGQMNVLFAVVSAGAIVALKAVMLKFYGHELVLGQMNVLFAVVSAGAIVALKAGRESAAGALVALAIVVKPYAVIFLPWLLARRRVAAVAAAAIGGLALLAAPALVYGVSGDLELHRGWWTTVTESTAPNLTNADNVSIAAMWAKWLGAGRAATLSAAATSIAVLAAVALAFRRRRGLAFPEALEGALLLTCIPLLSPQGWDYVFLISTPAVVLLLNYADRLPPRVRWFTMAALAIIGFTVYDLIGRTAYAAFMSLSIVTVCYLVVIAGVCTLRARRIA